MRKTRAKQLHKLAFIMHNPKSAGLLHQGSVTLFQETGGAPKADPAAPWMIRIFQRKYAGDSLRKRYQMIKRGYTLNDIKLSFVNRTIAWFDKMMGVHHANG